MASTGSRGYYGADPAMMENDVFRFVLALADETPIDTANMVVGKTPIKILEVVEVDTEITIPEIASSN